MWKVLLLFACVAGSAIVFCDDELTPTYKCGPNQVFSNCTNGGCEARNCSQVGKPVACVKLDPKSCKKGCVCASGYLLTSNGTCVLRNQCNEGCGGDDNAHPGCGVNCGRTCSTYMKKNVACILICYLDGCDCNDGYVYDPNVKKCVKPNDCTPTCGINEIFSTCINGGCGYKNCSQIGKPEICVDPAPGACIKGCVCADGFLRLANGTCVPQDQCPASNQCPGQNEFYDTCISGCSNQSCDSIGKVIHCPIQTTVCREGCRCKAGYWRNLKNVCVLESECPPVVTTTSTAKSTTQ